VSAARTRARTCARHAVPAATTLALVLAAPSFAWAAQADPGDEQGRSGASNGQPESPGKSGEKGAQQGGQGTDADPAGNNGTIKIDGVPLDDGRGNEPHVDCAFALDFYGFDAGQTADITFTGKAPTGPEGVLLAQKGVAVSDDAAGGGQDRDAELSYTASQLGLTGTAPHRQGWHVKVTVDSLEAPGGTKQKVFWIDCGETATAPTGDTPTTGTGTAPTGSTPTTGTGTAPTTGTTTDTTTGTTTGTVSGTTTGTTTEVTGGGGIGITEQPGAAVAGAYGELSPAASGVAGTAANAATLPRTGGELAMLVLLGLSAIGVGAAGVIAGRESRAAHAA
jgi:hypothetical protein